MTTTAYDTHFIASDIAFTDEEGNVYLNIPFRKVKIIGSAVIGMAGCLECMLDFSQMVLDFILQHSKHFSLPVSIIERKDSDFIAIIYINGMCLKIEKLQETDIKIDNITQIPTVIGSGSQYVQGVLEDCPNAVVAVLEAIKHDKYTDGEVKYCSIRRLDIHNLEIDPMSTKLEIQLTGISQEIKTAREFMQSSKSKEKSFHASTEVYYLGKPSTIPTETGFILLEQGFGNIRDTLKKTAA